MITMFCLIPRWDGYGVRVERWWGMVHGGILGFVMADSTRVQHEYEMIFAYRQEQLFRDSSYQGGVKVRAAKGL